MWGEDALLEVFMEEEAPLPRDCGFFPCPLQCAPMVGGQEARQGSIWLVVQMVPIQQGLFSQFFN